MKRGERVSVLILLGASVLWATSFVANDAGVKHLPGAAFALYRFTIAGIASALFAIAVGGLRAGIFREPGLWLIAAFNALGMACQYWGQERTTPARTALFVNASVFAIAGLSYLLFRERLGRGKGVAVAVAFAGVALIETDGAAFNVVSSRLATGDLLALVGGITLSGYAVFSKAAVSGGVEGASWIARVAGSAARLEKYPLTGNLAAIFLATAALLLPLAVLTSPGGVPPPPPRGAWVPLVWTALACTSLAYGSWMWTFKHVGATTASVILLTEVLFAALLSTALGIETLTPVALAGGFLIFAATLHVARQMG